MLIAVISWLRGYNLEESLRRFNVGNLLKLHRNTDMITFFQEYSKRQLLQTVVPKDSKLSDKQMDVNKYIHKSFKA